MNSPSQTPEGLILDKPSAARIYDYLLGGFHNFEIDRLAAEQALQILPDVRLTAQANRAFLRRVVNFLVEQGIDQFLDIGSGIPTVGNVHEIAQAGNATARVVYVDIDPVAVSHSRSMLQGNPNASVTRPMHASRSRSSSTQRPGGCWTSADQWRFFSFRSSILFRTTKRHTSRSATCVMRWYRAATSP